jgi:hypothetical protein
VCLAYECCSAIGRYSSAVVSWCVANSTVLVLKCVQMCVHTAEVLPGTNINPRFFCLVGISGQEDCSESR